MGAGHALARQGARGADADRLRGALQDVERRHSRAPGGRTDRSLTMPDAFKDHFSERAAGYASYRPHYTPELAEWLASLAPARRLAWDVACGSGQLSTLLGDRFDKVVATDASREQVGQATPHARVEYRVEPAETSS